MLCSDLSLTMLCHAMPCRVPFRPSLQAIPDADAMMNNDDYEDEYDAGKSMQGTLRDGRKQKIVR